MSRRTFVDPQKKYEKFLKKNTFFFFFVELVVPFKHSRVLAANNRVANDNTFLYSIEISVQSFTLGLPTNVSSNICRY